MGQSNSGAKNLNSLILNFPIYLYFYIKDIFVNKKCKQAIIFRMAAVELQKQWAELEPNKGFSFENFERNAKLIKNKVRLKVYSQ